MKNYDVKFEKGQEVFIIYSNKILKVIIDSFKITDSYQITDSSQDGVKIEYLITMTLSNNNVSKIISEWFNEEDIYLNKEEIIKKFF